MYIPTNMMVSSMVSFCAAKWISSFLAQKMASQKWHLGIWGLIERCDKHVMTIRETTNKMTKRPQNGETYPWSFWGQEY